MFLNSFAHGISSWEGSNSLIILQDYADITTHAKALSHKYQKFMGVRPSSHVDEMFKDTSIHTESNAHLMPVSNFLNAQCKRICVVFIQSTEC